MMLIPRAAPEPEIGQLTEVEWEECNCPLCEGRNYFQLVEAPDNSERSQGLWFVVVQCQDCGLCFTNPRPNLSSIGQFYPPDYLPHQTPKDRSNKWLRGWPKKKKQQIIPWHGQGRLLDFGCGGGSFLAKMYKRGWHVLGMDASAAAVYRVRTELGLPAKLGSLPHAELEPESFDVITMWESLEHVHDPVEVLRQAHQLLVPGGKIFISVPNIDSLPFRWFGHAWSALDLPRHLTHFAPWTLRLMLQRAGFLPGKARMVRHSNWLRKSASLACRDPRASWRRLLKLKTTSRLLTWYSARTSQADCMMMAAVKK